VNVLSRRERPSGSRAACAPGGRFDGCALLGIGLGGYQAVGSSLHIAARSSKPASGGRRPPEGVARPAPVSRALPVHTVVFRRIVCPRSRRSPASSCLAILSVGTSNRRCSYSHGDGVALRIDHRRDGGKPVLREVGPSRWRPLRRPRLDISPSPPARGNISARRDHTGQQTAIRQALRIVRAAGGAV